MYLPTYLTLGKLQLTRKSSHRVRIPGEADSLGEKAMLRALQDAVAYKGRYLSQNLLLHITYTCNYYLSQPEPTM